MNNSIYRFLFEQEDPSENSETISDDSAPRLSKDSVDDQIDSFLIFYEKRAIESSKEELNEKKSFDDSLRRKSLRFLFEQEEPPAEEEPPPEEEPPEEEPPAEEGGDTGDTAPAEDSEEEPPAGSEEFGDVEAAAIKSPPINIDKFTKSVARLALNPEDLLDLKVAIINRSKNFLLENYGEQHVAKFKEILDTQFGIDLQTHERETSSEDVFGLGANPAGAGMSGG